MGSPGARPRFVIPWRASKLCVDLACQSAFSERKRVRNPTGETVLSNAIGGGLFFPHDGPACAIHLRRQAVAVRQTAVLALGMRWRWAFPALTQALADFCARPYAQRERLIEEPILRIAVTLLSRVGTGDAGAARSLVDALINALGGADMGDVHLCRVSGTDIIIHRYMVPELLRRVSPPSYTFPDRALVRTRRHAYTVDFFREVCQTALSKVHGTWPELHDDLVTCIKRLVHVPDADFRSCSAARYAGVVFLSDNDDRLVEVEESLVREYAHQILYTVMELDPLLASPVSARSYRLPWSGSSRDLYGYFHAFYMYVILACYYARVATAEGVLRDGDEHAFCRGRQLQIVHGLILASDDFTPELFTPAGQDLRQQLLHLVEQMAAAHPAARQLASSSSLIE